MTVADRLLVLLAAAAVALAFALVGRGGQGQRVVVEQDGKVVFTAELSRPLSHRFDGPAGVVELTIAGGEARVTEAHCPDKVCQRSGAIRAAGEILACVPNRLVIRIEGPTEARPYDLLSR